MEDGSYLPKKEVFVVDIVNSNIDIISGNIT
jgi:hypothetical protein